MNIFNSVLSLFGLGIYKKSKVDSLERHYDFYIRYVRDKQAYAAKRDKTTTDKHGHPIKDGDMIVCEGKAIKVKYLKNLGLAGVIEEGVCIGLPEVNAKDVVLVEEFK